MRLIDADALKKAIIKHLCVKSENNLLPAEKSIYNCIDEQPTIELLKEQQPRVLTYDEMKTMIGKPVYVEEPKRNADPHCYWGIVVEGGESETRRCFDSYEKYFRLWDKEPTKEQRNAVPWKDGE